MYADRRLEGRLDGRVGLLYFLFGLAYSLGTLHRAFSPQ